MASSSGFNTPRVKIGLNNARYSSQTYDLNDEYVPDDITTPQFSRNFNQRIREEESNFQSSTPSLTTSFTPTGSISRQSPRATLSHNSPAYKLRKTRPYGQLQQANSSSKLQRIFSENETSNFSQLNGRRLYHDQRHRPHRTKFYEQQTEVLPDPQHNLSSRSFTDFYESDTTTQANRHQGLEDEYIPDFDFSNTIQQWTDSYYTGTDYDPSFDSSLNDSMPSSFVSRPATPVGRLHAQVDPVSVPKSQREKLKIKTSQDSLTTDEELLVSKLPQNFTDLPFSVRRKLLADISPNGNMEALNKIVKKKFRRQKSSPAVQFLSSFSERSYKPDGSDNVVLGHSMGSIIGFGAWGVIRECSSSEGHQRAMKVVRVKNDAAREFFKRETKIWSQLHHENILRLISVKESSSAIFCLSDRAYGGTLFDVVSNWGVYPSETIQVDDRLTLIRQYASDILSGLTYMHSQGIVHGDVKLENCLVLDKTSNKILICDFGMSLRFKAPVNMDEVPIPGSRKIRRPSIPRSYSGGSLKSPKSLLKIFSERTSAIEDQKSSHEGQLSFRAPHPTAIADSPADPEPFEYTFKDANDPNLPHSHIGSLPYAAPELLESQPPPLGPSADTWAFGVLLYTMIVGKLPFQHSFEPRLRAMIAAGKYDTEILKSATHGDTALYDAVVGCLTIDMNKRSSLREVLAFLDSEPSSDC